MQSTMRVYACYSSRWVDLVYGPNVSILIRISELCDLLVSRSGWLPLSSISSLFINNFGL